MDLHSKLVNYLHFFSWYPGKTYSFSRLDFQTPNIPFPALDFQVKHQLNHSYLPILFRVLLAAWFWIFSIASLYFWIMYLIAIVVVEWLYMEFTTISSKILKFSVQKNDTISNRNIIAPKIVLDRNAYF